MLFLTLFQFLTRLLTYKQLKLSWEKWNDVKNVLFSSSNAKNENQLKPNIHVHNRIFIDSLVFQYVGLYLQLSGEHIKDKRLH